MDPDDRMIWDEAESITGPLIPTGSRLFCPSGLHESSDFDGFTSVSESQIQTMIERDWVTGTSMENPDGSAKGLSGLEFVSLKKEKINVIGFLSRDLLERYELATELCKALGGPTHRKDRVLVFRAILYNEYPS